MKTIMLIILLAVGHSTFAQFPNFSEWFSQKKTQRKYLVEQIVALQVYLGFVKKGYQIADKGLTMIGDIKSDIQSQDETYYNSLKQVSPVIRDSPKYWETISLQQTSLRDLHKLADDAKDDSNFLPKEVAYIQKVYEKMQSESMAAMDAFVTAVSANVSEMTDTERLTRLDKVHEEMQDRMAFSKHFVSTTHALSIQRAKEKRSTEVLKKLNGLN